MTTKTRCRSTGPHGTYWAYDKHGCRCLDAAVDASRIRRLRRAGDTGLIRNATGACRTARGLAVHGYTVDQIAAAAGVSDRLIAALQAGKDTIRTSKDRALRAAAERLIAAPPPTGWSASRARSAARRNGWVPLLAWDDIDDPNAQPTGVLGRDDDRDDSYDEVTVALAVEGRLTYAQLNAHRPDLIEAVRRLARTLGDLEIAHRLRVPGAGDVMEGYKTRGQATITGIRARAGIPACPRQESIAPRIRRSSKAA
jgi:transcriptional regulator with XRE-family HTH domain